MSDRPSRRILVACIGNIFLGDDGFGCEVARALKEVNLPDEVRVIDYGIRGLDLAFALLKPYQAVILVDAIMRGESPGSVSLLCPADAAFEANVTPDAHAMDPRHLMAVARSLGEITAQVYIIGCEPLDFGSELEGRMGLSPQVREAVPAAVLKLIELIEHIIGDKPQLPVLCYRAS